MREYLRGRGLEYEYEPDVEGRNPDYLVSVDGLRVGLEVYEPELKLPRDQALSFSSPDAIRGGFRGRKYKQAKAARKAGFPFIVAIGSSNSDITFEPLMIASGMFGQLTETLRVDTTTGGAVWTGTEFGAGALLQQDRNRAVSAAVRIERFNPTDWIVADAFSEERKLFGFPERSNREHAASRGNHREGNASAPVRPRGGGGSPHGSPQSLRGPTGAA